MYDMAGNFVGLIGTNLEGVAACVVALACGDFDAESATSFYYSEVKWWDGEQDFLYHTAHIKVVVIVPVPATPPPAPSRPKPANVKPAPSNSTRRPVPSKVAPPVPIRSSYSRRTIKYF